MEKLDHCHAKIQLIKLAVAALHQPRLVVVEPMSTLRCDMGLTRMHAISPLHQKAVDSSIISPSHILLLLSFI